MSKRTGAKLVISLFFLFFLPSLSHSQLSDFTLTVVPTPETCSGNGALSWSTTNTTPGSSVLFSIYHLPDVTNPIAVQATTSLDGLTAGDYMVIATQTLGSSTNTESETVTIASLIIDLDYNLTGTNVVCGLDGTITVEVTQGTAVAYEIFAGPVLVAPQPSNVLTGLSAGVYQVRVFDACGEGEVQTYEIFNSTVGLSTYVQSPVAGDCDTLLISLSITPGGSNVIAFPLTIHCVVTTPTGEQLVFDQIIPFNGANVIIYSEQIPYFEGEVYSYSVTITDNCGNQYTNGSTISNFAVDPIASFYNSTCTDSGLYVHNVTALILLTAPAAYQGSVPEDLTSQINGNNVVILTNMPLGVYTFLATGLCGQQVPLTVTILAPQPPFPGVVVLEGCEVGFGSFLLYGQYTTVSMISAPSTYPSPIPQDMTPLLDPTSGSLALNTLLPGEYILHTEDDCGYEFDVVVNIAGYQQTTTVNIFELCNSFNIQLLHSSNGQNGSFWLQKYDAINNEWEHPATGSVYTEGTIPTQGNSLMILNNAITYNLGYAGVFRIVKGFSVFNTGPSGAMPCVPVVHQFEYNPGPKIINVYSLACSNNTYDMIVDAIGSPPLIYRITSKNGAPFIINNLTSSIFLGLDPAIYNVQVEDSCGNILNRLFDIPTPFPLAISGTGLCDGQTGSLSVPYFPFLQYSWWKGNDTSTILSTNGSLAFSPFDAATDGGMYHVSITYANPGSCIDIVLDFEVTPATSNPEAGTGMTISYCQRPNTVDLYSLLVPPFNSGGVWQDMNGTGSLSDNQWSTSNIPAGTYHFNYTVTGLCTSDETEVTIILNPIPAQPVVLSEIEVCSGGDISLVVNEISGNSYQWSGPNNFSSTEPSPVLSEVDTSISGNYYVTATLGDCTSLPAIISVNVIPPPEFSLIPGCDNNRFTIGITSGDTSIINESSTFQWSGPDGYSAVGNPIDITGEVPGNYFVNVITDAGCSAASQILIDATLCSIPQGISPNNDSLNDDFDLSGFAVINLKIFNRYGVTVFEQGIYKNEWHGQDKKGRELPAGAYYYLIDLKGGEVKSGWVYVNREF
ncbi:MAG TPA: gliding motility-associated C-terminal domain-containing protein [Flavobacterium sp.]